mgnify:FL=1
MQDISLAVKVDKRQVKDLKALIGQVEKQVGTLNKVKITLDTTKAVKDLEALERSAKKLINALGKPGGIRAVKNSLVEISNASGKVSDQFRKATTAAERQSAALGVLALRFKALREEGRSLVLGGAGQTAKGQGMGLTGQGGSATGAAGSIENIIKDLSGLPRTLAASKQQFAEIDLLLENSVAGSKAFNLLAKARKDFLERELVIREQIKRQQTPMPADAFGTKVPLLPAAGQTSGTFTIQERNAKASQEAVRSAAEKLRIERFISRENANQARTTRAAAKERLNNIRKIRRRRQGQRLNEQLLGAGFPLLFGGGAGAVGGSILGGALGAPFGAAFGGQIFGSAIGTQLEMALQKVTEIGTAVETIDVERLRENNIRITDELAAQVEFYKEQGKFSKARTAVEFAVFKQTGALPGVTTDIANNFNLLVAAGNEFLAVISTTLGILSAPFITALAGILKVVNIILQGFNTLASIIGVIIKVLGTGMLKGLGVDVDGLAESIGNANGQLDAMSAKAREAAVSVSKGFTDSLDTINKLKQTLVGTDFATTMANLTTEEDFAVQAIRKKTAKDFGLGLAPGTASQVVALKAGEIGVVGAQFALKREQLQARDLKSAQALERQFSREVANRQAVTKLEQEKNKINAEYADRIRRLDELGNTEEARQARILAKQVQTTKLADAEAKARVRSAQAQDALLSTQAGFEMQLETLRANAPGAFSGLFGGSERMASLGQMEMQFALEKKDREIEIMRQRVSSGSAFQSEVDNLVKSREQYALYQTQILDATVAQERFAEALALTQPVTDSLFDSLIAVADGTKSAQEAFADFLRSIASMLVDTAKQMIAQYIAIGIARTFAGLPKMSSGKTVEITKISPKIVESLGGIGERALGGSVSSGRPYMVGERGPELFVPGAQGNIVPNSAMGSANVVVNVDASGSSVEGDADQASQLGKVIGIAVQQELVKQKRPGGLLAS